jgi:D-alanine-D-alanine ligase
VTGRPPRFDIPVLLLHDEDPAWESEARIETERAVQILADSLRNEGHVVRELAVRDGDLAGLLREVRPADHVVLNWCEELPGVPRSESHVAAILQEQGFVYTGSPPDVLERCWDRRRVKARLEEHGIPTPQWVCVRPGERLDSEWSRFPAIVKPAWEHCSVGISSEAVVLDAASLANRVAFVWESLRQPAMVEEFIDGRELHVTVWGNGTLDVLPIAEMDFSWFADVRDRLCTFDSKFTPGSTHYEHIEVLIPAPMSEAGRRAVEQVCLRTYRAFGCRDYARIDLRLRGETCMVLDVNPNSDLGHDTSTACAAEVAGLSYGAFVSGLVKLAAHRHAVV